MIVQLGFGAQSRYEAPDDLRVKLVSDPKLVLGQLHRWKIVYKSV